MRGRPPAGCSTFAREDFSRVPFPAARITITTSLFGIVRLFSPALHALTIVGREFAEYSLQGRNPAGGVAPPYVNCAMAVRRDLFYILRVIEVRYCRATSETALEA